MTLEICGLGIIFYSPPAAAHIAEGENYLIANYMAEDQVQPHIQRGTIVGFGTASPGVYILHILKGYPDAQTLAESTYKLRLGIEVKDNTLCFRDLYDLMDWTAECPPEQCIALDDGYYHITLCSNRPESGIVGDNQHIQVYFNTLNQMPNLVSRGVPTLVTD